MVRDHSIEGRRILFLSSEGGKKRHLPRRGSPGGQSTLESGGRSIFWGFLYAEFFLRRKRKKTATGAAKEKAINASRKGSLEREESNGVQLAADAYKGDAWRGAVRKKEARGCTLVLREGK